MKRMASPDLPLLVTPSGRRVFADDLPRFQRAKGWLIGFVLGIGFVVLLAFASVGEVPR